MGTLTKNLNKECKMLKRLLSAQVRVRRSGSRLSTSSATHKGTTAMKTSRKTIMGTTAGTTILVISGTVVMWPMSDLFFGPKLIQLGLYSHDGSAQEKASADDSSASITIVANRSGRDIRREAEKNNRPVVYISLREATSSHDLFMAMVSMLFSYEKLGIIGTLSQSMGIWWIVLFDMVMGTDPPHTRRVHFSVLLQHTKRALQMHTALYPHSRRCATRERKAPLPPLFFILYFSCCPLSLTINCNVTPPSSLYFLFLVLCLSQ